MAYRLTLHATALLSCLFLSVAAAAAQTPQSSISGPAMGTNVEPSAAVQKQSEGRSASSMARDPSLIFTGSALSAGAPGVEGAPGTESGR